MKMRMLSGAIALLLAPAVNAELFISEYVEGSSNNKALEVYNPTNQAISLNGYAVKVHFNGNPNPTATINLEGTLAANSAFVLVSNQGSAELRALANQITTTSLWNGDDAITLTKNNVVIDSFGQVGVDPGTAWGSGDTSTVDKTLRRKSVSYDTNTTDEFNPAVEWDGFPRDTYSDLGFFNGQSGGGGGGEGPDPDPTPDPTPNFSCAAPVTAISAIQGSADTSPLVGQVVQVEAVVTQLLPGLRGYTIQAVGAEQDANDATSEGLFVYLNSQSLGVSVGQRVRLQGTVAEAFTQTQLSSISATLDCGSSALPQPKLMALPVSSLQELEAVEGMLVQFPQVLTVNDTYTLGRYGELTVSNGRRYTPTHVAAPGAQANALESAHKLNKILIDDANSAQNPATVPFPTGGLSAANTLRNGDTVVNLTGTVHYSFDEYRVMPTNGVNFIHSNPRTASPELAAGANVKVGSFNVLNYFNGNGTGGGFPTARGAHTAVEFERQRAKVLAALAGMDASVIGLMEIENDGYASTSAIADLIRGLREETGNESWQFINAGGPVGTDEIAVGIIYRADMVAPEGSLLILDSSNSAKDEQGRVLFVDTQNRPMMSQRFSLLENGAQFAVMVNHLKSKGSSCGSSDPDLGDGQGNCNLARTKAAKAIGIFAHEYFADIPAIVMGDLNAYAKEDPVRALEQAGYVNVFDALEKVSYGYSFSGYAGSLDHALLNDMALLSLVDATKWHINADEPLALDYNVEFKSALQQVDYYAADQYRSSDHDPVIVALDLPPAVEPLDASVSLLRATAGRLGMKTVQLNWQGELGTLTIYRDNEPLRLLTQPSRYNDSFRTEANSVTYKICEQATNRCTPDLVVNF